MPVPQQKFRELVFQMLYGYDMGHTDENELISLLMKELSVTKKTANEAHEKVTKIAAVLPELDDMINHTSTSYKFNRIQTVERNILRLGLFEILFDDSIPPKVAISEALRLARKFSTPESATFVNAILDTVFKLSKGEHFNPEEILKVSKELEESEERAKKASEKTDEEE